MDDAHTGQKKERERLVVSLLDSAIDSNGPTLIADKFQNAGGAF